MEARGQVHAPATLLMGKKIGTHWLGDWVGTKVGLDVLEKKEIPYCWRDLNPGPSSLQPSLYTYCVLLSPVSYWDQNNFVKTIRAR
jgi:hypothetical protein